MSDQAFKFNTTDSSFLLHVNSYCEQLCAQEVENVATSGNSSIVFKSQLYNVMPDANLWGQVDLGPYPALAKPDL